MSAPPRGELAGARPFDDQPWADQALCRKQDPEMFFPKVGNSTRHAKDICNGCQALAACRDYALDNRIPHGVWGGLSERERRTLLRNADKGRRHYKPRRLTEDQVDEVVRLYDSGLNSTEVGALFRINPNLILRRLHERGVTIRPSNRRTA